MFQHRSAQVGFVVSFVGWGLLLFGSASPIQILGREIINLHSLEIAKQIILLGYILFIAGIVAKGFQTLTAGALPGNSTGNPAPSSNALAMAEPQIAMERALMEKGLR